MWGSIRVVVDAQIKACLVVQVALGLLYEAKFDVIQQEADAKNKTGERYNLTLSLQSHYRTNIYRTNIYDTI